jgi:hypothetical protein
LIACLRGRLLLREEGSPQWLDVRPSNKSWAMQSVGLVSEHVVIIFTGID